MIGKTVSHYEILEKLGEGGMGVVYKALDTRLHRHVAIKFLPPGESANDQARTRLSHEARALSALNHSNIAVIHEIDETDDGRLFIVMAYYEGKTLKDKLAEGALDAGEAVEIIAQVAAGLASAHEKGILHRDIKPANVLFGEDGHAKLADFGLARLSDQTRVTRTGTTVGTVAYMSPEQARGDVADQRSDVYSLGVVLYELLTGDLPFQAEHQAALLFKIMSEDPPPLPGEFGAELGQIVGRALEKDPGARYADAREFLEDLNKLGTGRKITVVRRRPRRRLLWSAVALALAVAVLGVSIRTVRQMARSPVIRSLAVLPFTSLGDDPEQALFSEGITGELIARLAQIGSLRVIAQRSVARYAGSDKSHAEIAAELGVEALVECSVRVMGDQMRVTAQLIDPQASEVLWGDSFGGSTSDALGLQGELAVNISQAVGARLTAGETERLASAPEVDPDVYRDYLRGRKASEGWGTEAWNNGVKFFNAVIERDGTFAPAYAGISRSYGFKDWFSPGEGFDEMQRAAAERALELDSTLAEGWVALAAYTYRKQFDWVSAETMLQRALELAPGNALCHIEYGNFLALEGRGDDAIAQMKTAIELDPLSMEAHRELGLIYVNLHRFDDAIDYLLSERSRYPEYVYTDYFLIDAYSGAGHHEEAMALVDSLSQAWPGAFENDFPYVYARAGQTERALQMLEAGREKRSGPDLWLTELNVYAALGMNDEFFSVAETLYDFHPVFTLYFNTEPLPDAIRDDPRYHDLLARVGLDR